MRALPVGMLLALIGCSPPMGRVHGTVTLDDQPLAGATVTFFAENQQAYSVTTGPDGQYELAGVPRGELKVTVQMPPPRPAPRPEPRLGRASDHQGDAKADDQAKGARRPPTPLTPPAGPRLPPRYADPDASGLSFILTGGEGTFDLRLSSRP